MKWPKWRQFSALQWALLVSVTAHVIPLSVRFVDPAGFDRAFRDTPLEVILVNARSAEAPAKAQAIAQANLAGGGEAEKGRATSPLLPSPTMQLGDADEDARRSIEHLQQEQQTMLTLIRNEIAGLPPPDPRREAGTEPQRDADEHRRQLMQLLAQVEKRINDENARPKKRYISPATREEVYALYYDKLRRRIEDRGTRNFPETGGQKLYGELTMNVTVDAAGRVVEADIVRPSGNRRLDQQAVAIVRAASPFGPFTAAMRAQADQIVVTSRFRFTREDGLETTPLVRSPGSTQ
ncbi:MAG: energy transducer TonB [Pseudomonadota bacterium]|nr:energy transducer TonB [Pseudomonadota bacterium]